MTLIIKYIDTLHVYLDIKTDTIVQCICDYLVIILLGIGALTFITKIVLLVTHLKPKVQLT